MSSQCNLNPRRTMTLRGGLRGIAATSCASILAACGGSGAHLPPTYIVGAFVSGLSGPGLVLQLNTSSNIEVNANGLVTFPTRLPYGANFTVTVEQQPSTPAQICSVANGSGTGGPLNASVTVTCALSIPCPTAPASDDAPGTASTVYILNGGGLDGDGMAQSACVIEYPADSSGPVSPTVSITLPSSASYVSLTTDSSGFIYVGSNAQQVLVFDPKASGMAAPIRTIAVPGALGLINVPGTPGLIAVDAAGNVYVTTVNGDGTPQILVFAAGASGSAAPIRSIDVNPGCDELAVDANGNIVCGMAEGRAIQVFTSTQSGNATPARTISGAASGLEEIVGMSLDPAGNIYVATAEERFDGPVTILEYAGGAGAGTENPILSLSGTALLGTRLVTDIGLDAAGNLYVLESNGNNAPSVLRLATGANGFASPTSETLLSDTLVFSRFYVH